MSNQKDDGGLMYQQLRKFINVIVSYYLGHLSLCVLFRMSSVMLVCSSSSSCPEFACWEASQRVRVQCWSPLLESTSCQEEMVWLPVDHSNCVSTINQESLHGQGSKRCLTRSSLTSRKSSRPSIFSLIKCAERAKILLTNPSC